MAVGAVKTIPEDDCHPMTTGQLSVTPSLKSHVTRVVRLLLQTLTPALHWVCGHSLPLWEGFAGGGHRERPSNLLFLGAQAFSNLNGNLPPEESQLLACVLAFVFSALAEVHTP